MRLLISGNGGSARRLALTALCLLMLALAACVPASAGTSARRTPAPATPPATSTPGLTHTQQVNARPARLIVPKIGLDAEIIPVGADANGAMLAPRNASSGDAVWSQVYWWDIGTAPGEVGNAAIAGHVNRPDGSPSTFTRLNELAVGDSFTVAMTDGQTLTFRVTEKEALSVYVRGSDDPTIGRIFGPAREPHLNLMTCWGEWDGKEYNRRLVIFSTLVPPATVGAQPSTSPAR